MVPEMPPMPILDKPERPPRPLGTFGLVDKHYYVFCIPTDSPGALSRLDRNKLFILSTEDHLPLQQRCSSDIRPSFKDGQPCYTNTG